MNPRTEEVMAGTITEQMAFQNGVDLLDAEIPYWYEKIDLETFDIRSSSNCVLGQLGGFGIMQSYLGFETMHETRVHGFEAFGTEDIIETRLTIENQYDELQKLWYDAIDTRQRGLVTG
jgi:hypothetical protein